MLREINLPAIFREIMTKNNNDVARNNHLST